MYEGSLRELHCENRRQISCTFSYTFLNPFNTYGDRTTRDSPHRFCGTVSGTVTIPCLDLLNGNFSMSVLKGLSLSSAPIYSQSFNCLKVYNTESSIMGTEVA
jgi:hypothetical protein